MMSKKQQIISAFENLDATMLDVLLNDDQPYQDVPKQLFVSELKKHFNRILNDDYYMKDYKAYKGTCQNCNKGKSGYSFINSKGQSFMSMVFEESEDDFTDIYKCGSFCTENKEIEEGMHGIFFYKDDEVNYISTNENIIEQKRCDAALEELNREIENEGILSKKFYIPWVEKYGDINDISKVFTGEMYSYQVKIKSILFSLDYIAKIPQLESLARKYWEEFIAFPIVSKESIIDWLIRCDKEFQYLKYGFAERPNFRSGYFDDRGLKIDLTELYFYHNISAILNKYFDWIPEECKHEDDAKVPF